MIDLQQQVARLQALLEVSRQVHAAVRPEEVLQSVLRIVVRELEMAGAHVTEPSLTVGEMPPAPWDGCARYCPAEQRRRPADRAGGESRAGQDAVAL